MHITLEIEHRSHMRHSSWTLFLVPLVLPLVLLLIPGARRSLDQSDSSGGTTYEQVDELAPSLSGSLGLPMIGPEENVIGKGLKTADKA